MTITQVKALTPANRREVKRFLKFATVGAAGSITDFVVLNVLIQVFGVSLFIGNAVSFTAAVCQNFTLNRLWTFPESRQRNAGRQLFQFTIVSIVGLTINQFVFLGVHRVLEPYWGQLIADPQLAFTVSYNFAKLMAIGVVLFWNFFANRIWTYRGI